MSDKPTPNIEIKPVQSSQIQGIGYDEATKTLAVQFKSGGTYHYSGVSPEEHQSLIGAESVGSYFHRNIKPNKERFPYTRIG